MAFQLSRPEMDIVQDGPGEGEFEPGLSAEYARSHRAYRYSLFVFGEELHQARQFLGGFCARHDLDDIRSVRLR